MLGSSLGSSASCDVSVRSPSLYLRGLQTLASGFLLPVRNSLYSSIFLFPFSLGEGEVLEEPVKVMS